MLKFTFIRERQWTQPSQVTWVCSTAFKLPTPVYETQQWSLDILSGYLLHKKETDPSIIHCPDRYGTGIQSRDQSLLVETLSKFLFRPFLLVVYLVCSIIRHLVRREWGDYKVRDPRIAMEEIRDETALCDIKEFTDERPKQKAFLRLEALTTL